MALSVTQILPLSRVADQIGVTRKTARKYAEQGLFPNAYRLPNGPWRVPVADIDAFKTKCRVTTTKADTIVTA